MLAIGRALMQNPRVLLMDEPSEGLAPQIVAEVMATIRKLKESGLSIVLVEQSPKLVFDIADDIVILNTGQVAVVSTAARASTATASICGSISACSRLSKQREVEHMADMWNKYEPTAARKRGKPGRETRPKSLTIDMHAHVVIPRAGEIAEPHLDIVDRSARPFLRRRDQGAAGQAGRRHPRRHPRRPTRASRRWTTWASTCSSICPAPPQIYYTVPLDIAVKATRVDQRRHRRICRQAPDRLVALGGVPMPDGNEAAKELERCMKQLRFKGVEILTNVAGKELSDPAFAPFWKKAEELGALVHDPSQRLHPGRAAHALLLQQRDRQSARDHDRAALPDLRRRAGAPPQPEDPRRARRRLSRRLFRPHRPRLGRALGCARQRCRSRRPTT